MSDEYKDQYPAKIRALAQLLKSHPAGQRFRLVLFLGAGAPRHAGLPLADELKQMVMKSFSDVPLPEPIRQGTLEDLMHFLQTAFGNDGYELVAQKMREYQTQPPSYDVIRNLILDGCIEAIATTNFDLLLDYFDSYAGVRLHFMTDDQSFASDVPAGAVLVAKLHGSASDSTSIKGSLTDTGRLSPRREEVLRGLITNHLTVFVGYAARDLDITQALSSIAAVRSGKRIWWVNPVSVPGPEIAQVLGWFDSPANYLPIDSEEFFRYLKDSFAPEPHPRGEAVARSRDLIGQLQGDPAAQKFLEYQQRLRLRQTQESEFQDAVNNACFAFHDDYVDESRRSILHQKASQRRNLDDFDVGPFGDVMNLLTLGSLGYHCVKVPTPGDGSLELVLQPAMAGKGGGLTHEFWFDVVAAAVYFQKRDHNGSGSGKGQVWGAMVHRVEFPGDSHKYEELSAWLNTEVADMFADALTRCQRLSIREGS